MRGGAECLTRQEIADRAAAEKKRKDDEIAERKRQEEAKRQAEIDARAKATEERRLAAEAEAKRKADEVARKAAEAEAKRKAESDAKQKAEEAKRLANEAEAKRRADEIATKAAEAEAKQRAAAEAKKKAEEAQREAAAVEAKRKADDAEVKRLAAEAEAKRKADEIAAAKALREEQDAARLQKQQDAKIDGQLEAIAKDTKQSPTNRAIAAIGLGKDPASYGIPNIARENSAPPSPTTRAERELAMLALGKTNPTINRAIVSNATPAAAERRMRVIMNDPEESAASRKIAAIALGKDPSNLGLNPPSVQPAATAATQPQLAPSASRSNSSQSNATVATIALPYQPKDLWQSLRPNGYPNGAAPSNASMPSQSQASKPNGTTSQPNSQTNSRLGSQTTDRKTNATNNLFDQIYKSKPVQGVIDSLAAAGGEAMGRSTTKGVPALGIALSVSADAAKIIEATRQRDNVGKALDIGQVVADEAAVMSAGKLGGPVAAATMQGAIDLQKATIAPVIGSTLFNKWPDFFTPTPDYQPIQVNPFTGRPVQPTR